MLSLRLECKKTSFILQFNQFLGDEKSLSPVNLRSPGTLETRLGRVLMSNPVNTELATVQIWGQTEQIPFD